MDTSDTNYFNWSHERLVDRVTELEQCLRELTAKHLETSSSTSLESTPTALRPKGLRADRILDPESYSTRFIALKFAYLGQRYGGFEHHANNPTKLPTIEEELWKALNKAKLIFPSPRLSTSHDEINFEGLDYAKCGRTDRGVSAFGQVVSLRVRSNRPRRTFTTRDEDTEAKSVEDLGLAALSLETDIEVKSTSLPLNPNSSAMDESLSFDHINDELPYCQILNRLLPHDIRVLAWCPAPPPNFSARFSCKERRYRYFFTQPAFSPTPGALSLESPRREGWLDIEAMRKAAKLYEGLHDFRNFCKVDSSKQIENFERRIYHADIREAGPELESASFVRKDKLSEHEIRNASPSAGSSSTGVSSPSKEASPKMYMFVLHGSAFLWHQVRHMVAILFLIGQGLESPELITQLLDIKANPTKPQYELAEDAPLVLWDCIFPEAGTDPHKDAIEWIYAGEHEVKGDDTNWGTWSAKGGKFGNAGIVQDVWKVWRQRKIDEALAGMLLNQVVDMGSAPLEEPAAQTHQSNGNGKVSTSQKVFLGGNSHVMKGKYVPMMERPRMESVEVINERYRVRKRINKNLEEAKERTESNNNNSNHKVVTIHIGDSEIERYGFWS